MTRRPSQDQPFDHRAGQDGEIVALPHAFQQIGRGRGDAAVGHVGQRKRKEAVTVSPVAIVKLGEVLSGIGLGHRSRKAGPVLPKQSPDADRTAQAMAWSATEVVIVLQPHQIGQNVIESPSGRAGFGPCVIVALQATHGEHAVDAGAAAHDTRLLITPDHRLTCVIGRPRIIGDAQVVPVKLAAEIGSTRIAVLDLRRDIVRRRVRARLDQTDAARAVGGQTVGQHRTRRTAADHNDIIVVHATDSGHVR